MPLLIVRNDITNMRVDAIVNAANSSLLGGGGVDGAIHAAAGPQLLAECRKLGGCMPGDAKVTKGYRLPSRYVIHTVGPVWQGGRRHEPELLASCYRTSLTLAAEKECESVAFPLISAGAYRYPKEDALAIAVREISRFLLDHEMLVYLVVYDRRSFQISRELTADIAEFIDEFYVETQASGDSILLSPEPDQGTQDYTPPSVPLNSVLSSVKAEKTARRRRNEAAGRSEFRAEETTANLTDMLSNIDESFSQMLLRKIDEKGLSDVECYKKANIDRKLFSKIRSNVQYKPSKQTAIAFAISLELSMPETEELLRKAGFALSHSSKFDIIIEYFIRKGRYDIFEINETLFAFDQCLLGA